MPDPTTDEFKARFTEFSVADSAIEQALSGAALLCGMSGYEPTLYAAAHILSLAAQNTGEADGGSGIVTMETQGPRTIQYENMSGGRRDRFFEQTPYGRMVLALESRSAAGLAVFFG